MKKYVYTKDFDERKKGEQIIADKNNYHEYIHPLIMRGVLKEIGKKSKEKDNKNMDLNGDGIVDDKDVSLAASVMARTKKIRKGVE